MKKLLITLTLAVVAAGLMAQTATPPSAGDGTTQPYEINSLENLYWIAEDNSRWASNYIQTADIDASATASWFGSDGWTPIGSENHPFTGSYIGGGYSISGLVVNRPQTDYIGLFGLIENAEISNLNLTEVDITGNYYVGGLMGGNLGSVDNVHISGTLLGSGIAGGLSGFNGNWESPSAMISNSSFSGTVNADFNVGGLCGANSGSIISCNSQGSVTGNSSGGISGVNAGIISLSYSTAQVSGDSDIGGLCGENGGLIDGCYATGAVFGSSNVGGLCGANYGDISNSYADGNVTGDGFAQHTGGLVGANWDGNISHSHATGDVVGDMFTGGLAGYNTEFGNISFSFATGNITGNDVTGGLCGQNQGMITDCYALGSATGSYVVGGLVGINGTWEMPGPGGVIINSYASGNVSGEYAVGGLVGRNDSWSWWIPNSCGMIENCHADGAINGEYSTGGLVGDNQGIINKSHASASVTGESLTGGLVGNNDGEISNSYSTSVVAYFGEYSGGTGGFVGLNYGAINNCYAMGATTGLSYVGGFTGENNGEISFCYSTGAVSGQDGDNTGGFCGFNSPWGTIIFSYWNTETSGLASSFGGTGRNSGEMTYPHAENTYVDWDFEDTWVADEDHSINTGYPYLSWQDMGVPAIQHLDGITILSGVSDCFAATETLSVSNFVVQNNGAAVLVAGITVLLQEGTIVESGGYLRAWIDEDENYCNQPESILAVTSNHILSEELNSEPEGKNLSFRIFPNPTTGVINLELEEPGACSVTIFNLMGKKIFKEEFSAVLHYQFDLSGFPAGMYMINVIMNDRIATKKIIRQ